MATVTTRPPTDTGDAAARRRSGPGRGVVPTAGSLVVVAAVWELIGQTTGFLFLPPLTRIAAALWGLLADGTIARELSVSLTALAGGMAIAVGAGIVIGTLMGVFPRVRDAFDVYLDAAMAAPMVAFVPVFILVFGLSFFTRMVTVIVFAFFPVVVNTYTGVRGARQDLLEMAHSFGARPRQLFWLVRLPMAWQHIRAGLRLGMARGVDGLITGEVLIAAVGLGGLVSRFGNAFTMDRLWAVVFTIIALALVAVRLTDLLGRLLVPQEPGGDTRAPGAR